MKANVFARVVAVLAMLGAAGRAGAQTEGCRDFNALPDTNGARTITEEGTYCLTDDVFLGGSTGTAITINASNVVLDLKGFHVHTWDTGDKSGIVAVDRSNVTVRNGSLSGFRFAAVNLTSSGALTAGNVVESLQLVNNGGSGINVAGRGALVRNNVLVETGKAFGNSWAIGLLGTGHRVIGNHIIGVRKTVGSAGPARGIWVNQCRDALLVDNTITGADIGILYDAATGVIRDNLQWSVTTPYLAVNGFGYANAGNNY